jgi:hypothetical protein
MTEQEFDRKVEEMAGRFERRVEASADRLEQGLTQRWNGSRWFRLAARAGSAAMGMGLLLGAASLRRKGFLTAARWCAAVGLVGLVCEMACGILWRRSE